MTSKEATHNIVGYLECLWAILNRLGASALLSVEVVLAALTHDQFAGAGHLDALCE